MSIVFHLFFTAIQFHLMWKRRSDSDLRKIFTTMLFVQCLFLAKAIARFING